MAAMRTRYVRFSDAGEGIPDIDDAVALISVVNEDTAIGRPSEDDESQHVTRPRSRSWLPSRSRSRSGSVLDRLSSEGGLVHRVKDQVDLRLRLSEDGDHRLQIAVSRRSRSASEDGSHLEQSTSQEQDVIIDLPAASEEEEEEEEEEGGALSVSRKCCTRSCTLVSDQNGSCRCRGLQPFKDRTLRNLKTKGSKVIREHLFPLFSSGGRVFLTLVQLLTGVLLFAMALPTFVEELKNGEVSPTDAVRMPISVVSLILAAIDAAFSNRKILCGQCIKPESQTNRISLLEKADKYSDLIRTAIAEILIYPVVICNIIDNASKRTYKGDEDDEKFAFVRFCLSAFWLITHVYVFRLIVIGGTIVLLEKARQGKSEKQVTHEDSSNVELQDDRNSDKVKLKLRAWRGIALEVYFLVHVLGQMLVQGLMLAAIWSKVQCENPDPKANKTSYMYTELGAGSGAEEQSLYISPFTWVMIVLGFLVPIAGTFTFFIPTYFWAQEFPMDFMVTMLTAVKKRSFLQIKNGSRQTVEKLEILLEKVEGSLKAHRVHFCRKFFFPLTTPHLVVLSLIYDVLLLSFAIAFFTGYTPRDDTFICPSYYNGPEAYAWALFSLVGIGLANIANSVVIFIGLFWISMIPVLLLFLPFFIPILPVVIAFIVYKICHSFGEICKYCYSRIVT